MLRGVKERDIGAHELEIAPHISIRVTRLSVSAVIGYRDTEKEKKNDRYIISFIAQICSFCICDAIVRVGLSFDVVPSARIRSINARFHQQCSILIFI